VGSWRTGFQIGVAVGDGRAKPGPIVVNFGGPLAIKLEIRFDALLGVATETLLGPVWPDPSIDELLAETLLLGGEVREAWKRVRAAIPRRFLL
jgi:hypothetical protein